jgi:hypothetical protein
MRNLAICTMVVLLAGCTGGVEYAKLRVKPGYTVTVDAPWQRVHECLYHAMQTYGWGEDWDIQQDIHPDQQRGTMWSYAYDPRYAWGFIVDTEAAGDDSTRIIVHPANGFFARKSREWITATVSREFGPDALQPPLSPPKR